ncbi:hypothetical protein BGZ65_012315, partial [Modicella reniformis]
MTDLNGKLVEWASAAHDAPNFPHGENTSKMNFLLDINQEPVAQHDKRTPSSSMSLGHKGDKATPGAEASKQPFAD